MDHSDLPSIEDDVQVVDSRTLICSESEHGYKLNKCRGERLHHVRSLPRPVTGNVHLKIDFELNQSMYGIGREMYAPRHEDFYLLFSSQNSKAELLAVNSIRDRM